MGKVTAASADDGFRQRLMARLVADARVLAAALPAEELDARALTAVKGLIAAAVALPEHSAFLTRALRVLPQELNRQVLPDGCHCERSPAQQLAVLMDLVEIRALLQAAQAPPPEPLARAIERMGPALRLMRHGDGGLALFNGTREEVWAREYGPELAVTIDRAQQFGPAKARQESQKRGRAGPCAAPGCHEFIHGRSQRVALPVKFQGGRRVLRCHDGSGRLP